MIKKIICFGCVLFLCSGCFLGIFAFATEPKETQNTNQEDTQEKTQEKNIIFDEKNAEFAPKNDSIPVQIDAKAALLMDANTGNVLINYHGTDRCYPASVTKIMPLLLVAEALDSGKISLSDNVSASGAAAAKGGSQIWLKEGETMSVEDLLKATAIYSANDACTALGEFLAGSEEGFVQLMNKRAKALGMKHTNFVNCTGLDDETTEHLTTAADIALMSRALLRHDSVTKYATVWMDSLRDGATELVNTNRLVRFYEGATGLKTGTTSKAGCCISASAKRGTTHLIAVVLGSKSSNERFDTAKRLLNWGFANFSTVTPELAYHLISPVRVLRGAQQQILPTPPTTMPILVPRGSEEDLQQTIELKQSIHAPVKQGQVLGIVRLTLDGETLGEYPLTAAAAVKKTNYMLQLRRLLSALLHTHSSNL